MRRRVTLFLLLAITFGFPLEAHAEKPTLTMRMWMNDSPHDQLLQVVGAIGVTSVFMACNNQQQSVGVIVEALKAGYTSRVFKPDDSFGHAFFRTLKPYDCVAYTDLMPMPTDKLWK